MAHSSRLYIFSYWTYNNPRTFVGAIRPYRMYDFFRQKRSDVLLITPHGTSRAKDEPTYRVVPENRWMRWGIFRAFPPDYTFLWSLKVLWKLRSELRRQPCCFLLTTCPPNGLVMAGLVGKVVFGSRLKWILDFRDLWTKHPLYVPPLTKKSFDPLLEKCAVRYADLILCNTTWDEAHWAARFPKYKARLLTVTNGFNELVCNHAPRSAGGFQFVYTGGTTAGQATRWVHRLLTQWQIAGVEADCDFYGEYDGLMDTSPNITYCGKVPHDEIPALLAAYRFGFIYLPQGSEEGGRVAQKFYDYLGSGVIPVCYRPSREMRRLMRELDTGISVDEGEDEYTTLQKLHKAEFRATPAQLVQLQRTTQFEKLYNFLPSLE